jgi:hypothetical protein
MLIVVVAATGSIATSCSGGEEGTTVIQNTPRDASKTMFPVSVPR